MSVTDQRTGRPVPGRRERKKAATRAAIADAALRLFLEHGYDQVGVKDIADAADVAVTTLFQHFPSKEAMVFDLDDDREAVLVAVVRDRRPDQSVLDALQDHFEGSPYLTADTDPFTRLVASTPALREYGHRMWTRHEAAVARAVTTSTGAPEADLGTALLVRATFDALALARDRPDPRSALAEAFTHLRAGWAEVGRTSTP